MTDPGGGYGWRTGRHLPRQRGGIFGWSRIADEEAHRFDDERALAVLLLPDALERSTVRERAEDLLTAPGVVAVDPPRLRYGAVARVSDTVADSLAAVQARRMRLPGFPRVLIVFHPDQYPLARSLRDLHPDAELWYGPADEPGDERRRALHERALERATWQFDHPGGPAHTQNLPLWERLEALGIESGRLGSERADIG
ncbi:MAG TPA: hypothetical protein VFX51_20895 [Solirubrobacteraceae bacterium]|nr:hypothetical protein [Solirubrobacteraceae bacterium]